MTIGNSSRKCQHNFAGNRDFVSGVTTGHEAWWKLRVLKTANRRKPTVVEICRRYRLAADF
jgi:hypothetical protein